MGKIGVYACVFFLVFMAVALHSQTDAYAADTFSIPNITIDVGGTNDPADVSASLQILFLISLITLAPSLLMMLTGFTRIVISLHFLRSALGTQQMPPNQVMIGLALILTLFLMGPTLTEINENALLPYSEGLLSAEEAFDAGMAPISRFMRQQVNDRDVDLFISLSGKTYESREDVPDSVIIPAFVLSELTTGFMIGFVFYLPFIVIDMVVASVLMAMGMMMLPPAMISLPFKIMLFILCGGWHLFIGRIMETFY